jgi:hypothetical protein
MPNAKVVRLQWGKNRRRFEVTLMEAGTIITVLGLAIASAMGWWLCDRNHSPGAWSFLAPALHRDIRTLQWGSSEDLRECARALREIQSQLSPVGDRPRTLTPETAITQILQVTNSTLEKTSRSEEQLNLLMTAMAQAIQVGFGGGREPKGLPCADRPLLEAKHGPVNHAAEFRPRPEPRRLKTWEYLAPFEEQRFPSVLDFVLVEFFDLSEDGVSFFLNELPTSQFFVVVLGNPPARIYLQAKVIRVVSMERHYVDCRLVRRLEPRPGFDLPTRIGPCHDDWVNDLASAHTEVHSP